MPSRGVYRTPSNRRGQVRGRTKRYVRSPVMSVRNNCTLGVQQVSVKWTYISYDEATEEQRGAWQEVLTLLLVKARQAAQLKGEVSPSQSYRPQLPRGGRVS